MLRSVFATDWRKRRSWSAVRRGLVVLVCLTLFAWIYSPDLGALASVAALYVGLQDRAADPPEYTVRIMLVQTVLMTAVVLVAGVSPNIWITWVVLVGFAVCSGLTARRDKAVSRMFGDIIAVLAFLGLQAVTPRYGLHAAIAVFCGGLLQTLVTRLALPFSSDLPERRPVATALLAVATHLDDAQTRAKRGTGEAATAAIRAADDSLARSDLSHRRRRALRKIVGDAEVLREEAASIRVRRAFETAVIDDQDVTEALAVASATLRTSARILATENRPAPLVVVDQDDQVAQLHRLADEAAEIADRKEARGSATSVAHQAERLVRHVDRLLESDPGREASHRRPRVRNSVADDLLAPRPIDLRSGARLGLAAALGLLLAQLLHLEHGGWVAATTVALLRPDHRALTSDTIARSAGTAIGAALVIPLVLVTKGMPAADFILVFVLAVATYVVTSANEGLYIIAITVETVFTRAVVGEAPLAVATSRFADVALGCAITVVLVVALPLKHGRRLRVEIAAYADAAADWLASVEVLATAPGKKKIKKRNKKELRELHRHLVSRRAAVQHALDLRRLEPLGPGLQPWLAYNLYTLIHDTIRACSAAQATISHGVDPPPESPALVARTASNLRDVSAALIQHAAPAISPGNAVAADATPTGPLTPADVRPTGTASSTGDPQQDVLELLQLAERESRAAAAAAAASIRPAPTPGQSPTPDQTPTPGK